MKGKEQRDPAMLAKPEDLVEEEPSGKPEGRWPDRALAIASRRMRQIGRRDRDGAGDHAGDD